MIITILLTIVWYCAIYFVGRYLCESIDKSGNIRGF